MRNLCRKRGAENAHETTRHKCWRAQIVQLFFLTVTSCDFVSFTEENEPRVMLTCLSYEPCGKAIQFDLSMSQERISVAEAMYGARYVEACSDQLGVALYWDFVDGASANGRTLCHAPYPQPGRILNEMMSRCGRRDQ